MSVEYSLFHDSDFMTSAQYSLGIFNKRWPLLAARLSQLRGETSDAINQYVVMRYNEHGLEIDGSTPINPQIQQLIDIYASYYLALAQLEKGDLTQARKSFEKTMRDLPEPDPTSRYYFSMFRWGAATNLGLLHGQAGNAALAERYLSQEIPTFQMHGNLVRAREMIFESPFVPPSETPAVIPPANIPAALRAT